MKLFALEMQQGLTPNTPAALCRWGVRLVVVLLLGGVVFLAGPVGFSQQQPAGTENQKAKQDQTIQGQKTTEGAKSAASVEPQFKLRNRTSGGR